MMTDIFTYRIDIIEALGIEVRGSLGDYLVDETEHAAVEAGVIRYEDEGEVRVEINGNELVFTMTAYQKETS